MSVRDIRGHLDELYGLEVSPDLISRVSDAVLDEVKEWRSRALDAVYPVVIFDAPRVKIRDKDSRIVKNKAVYLALGITGDGERQIAAAPTAAAIAGRAIEVPISVVRSMKAIDSVLEMLSTKMRAIMMRTTLTWVSKSSTVLV